MVRKEESSPSTDRQDRRQRPRGCAAEAANVPLPLALREPAFASPECQLPGSRPGRAGDALNRRPRPPRRGLSVFAVAPDRRPTAGLPQRTAASPSFLHVVGDTLRSAVGLRDRLHRWDGNGFLVVCPSATRSAAVTWAETIRQTLARRRIEPCGENHIVTVSIGLAQRFPTGREAALARRAKRALRLAQQAGGDRVCTWDLVVFQRSAARLGRGPSCSPPEVRWQQLLRSYERRLGPTQWDHLTAHSVRVAELAVCIGRLLGLDDAALRSLRIAGLLHDVGKLLVPEEVLAKPARLSSDEHGLVRRHVEDGAAMGTWLGIERQAAEFVRYHHTRFDAVRPWAAAGTATIPFGAHILAVADALVAMTSARPYQPARSISFAIQELRRARGTQFDPAVVDAVARALPHAAPISENAALPVPATTHTSRTSLRYYWAN